MRNKNRVLIVAMAFFVTMIMIVPAATISGDLASALGKRPKLLPITITSASPSLPVSGVAPLTVAFTCNATGGSGDYTYSWNFGDGGSSTERNPTHTYVSAGKITAKVTVTDAMPGIKAVKWTSAIITVQKPPKVDSDNDGLTDDREKKFGTDPLNRDTDLDGLWDGEEVNKRLAHRWVSTMKGWALGGGKITWNTSCTSLDFTVGNRYGWIFYSFGDSISLNDFDYIVFDFKNAANLSGRPGYWTIGIGVLSEGKVSQKDYGWAYNKSGHEMVKISDLTGPNRVVSRYDIMRLAGANMTVVVSNITLWNSKTGKLIPATDPLNRDTDGDGLWDGEEVNGVKLHESIPTNIGWEKSGGSGEIKPNPEWLKSEAYYDDFPVPVMDYLEIASYGADGTDRTSGQYKLQNSYSSGRNQFLSFEVKLSDGSVGDDFAVELRNPSAGMWACTNPIDVSTPDVWTSVNLTIDPTTFCNGSWGVWKNFAFNAVRLIGSIDNAPSTFQFRNIVFWNYVNASTGERFGANHLITNPLKRDSDNDGLYDGEEVFRTKTNPNAVDSETKRYNSVDNKVTLNVTTTATGRLRFNFSKPGCDITEISVRYHKLSSPTWVIEHNVSYLGNSSYEADLMPLDGNATYQYNATAFFSDGTFGKLVGTVTTKWRGSLPGGVCWWSDYGANWLSEGNVSFAWMTGFANINAQPGDGTFSDYLTYSWKNDYNIGTVINDTIANGIEPLIAIGKYFFFYNERSSDPSLKFQPGWTLSDYRRIAEHFVLKHSNVKYYVIFDDIGDWRQVNSHIPGFFPSEGTVLSAHERAFKLVEILKIWHDVVKTNVPDGKIILGGWYSGGEVNSLVRTDGGDFNSFFDIPYAKDMFENFHAGDYCDYVQISFGMNLLNIKRNWDGTLNRFNQLYQIMHKPIFIYDAIGRGDYQSGFDAFNVSALNTPIDDTTSKTFSANGAGLKSDIYGAPLYIDDSGWNQRANEESLALWRANSLTFWVEDTHGEDNIAIKFTLTKTNNDTLNISTIVRESGFVAVDLDRFKSPNFNKSDRSNPIFSLTITASKPVILSNIRFIYLFNIPEVRQAEYLFESYNCASRLFDEGKAAAYFWWTGLDDIVSQSNPEFKGSTVFSDVGLIGIEGTQQYGLENAEHWFTPAYYTFKNLIGSKINDSRYLTDASWGDTDGDGLSSGAEIAGWNITVNGAQIHVTSDPDVWDTDADGLSDSLEIAGWTNAAGAQVVSNPNAKDTDADGLSDYAERNFMPCVEIDKDAVTGLSDGSDKDHDRWINLGNIANAIGGINSIEVSYFVSRPLVGYPNKIGWMSLSANYQLVISNSGHNYSIDLPNTTYLQRYEITNVSNLAAGTTFHLRIIDDTYFAHCGRTLEFFHMIINERPATNASSFDQNLNAISPRIRMNVPLETSYGWSGIPSSRMNPSYLELLPGDAGSYNFRDVSQQLFRNSYSSVSFEMNCTASDLKVSILDGSGHDIYVLLDDTSVFSSMMIDGWRHFEFRIDSVGFKSLSDDFGKFNIVKFIAGNHTVKLRNIIFHCTFDYDGDGDYDTYEIYKFTDLKDNSHRHAAPYRSDGGLIFSDDFQDKDISDWDRFEGQGGDISIDNTNGKSHAPCMQMISTVSTGDDRASYAFKTIPVQTDDIVAQAAVMINRTDDAHFSMKILDSGGDFEVFLEEASGGELFWMSETYAGSGVANPHLIYTLLPNKWYTITVAIDVSAQKYQIYINNALICDDASLWDTSEPHDFKQIAFSSWLDPNVPSSTFWMDDVVIRKGGIVEFDRSLTRLVDDQFTDGSISDWVRISTGGPVQIDSSQGSMSPPSMELTKIGSTGSCIARHYFEPQRGNIIVGAKIKVNSIVHKAIGYFALVDGGVFDGSNWDLIVAFKGGNLSYYGYDANGICGWHTLRSISAGRWYQVTLFVNVADHKYDIYLDGEKLTTGEQAGFYYYNSSILDNVYFKAGYDDWGSAITMWVDEVIVINGTGRFLDQFFLPPESNSWILDSSGGQPGQDSSTGRFRSPALRIATISQSGTSSAERSLGKLLENFTVEMSIAMNSTDTNQSGLVALGDGTKFSTCLVFNQGQLCYYDGTYHDTGISYAPYRWYLLSMDVDTRSQTYDLYLDGALIKSDIGFWQQVDLLTAIYMQTSWPSSGPGATMWIDDIMVFYHHFGAPESLSISIKNGVQYTSSTSVDLSLSASDSATPMEMRFSNDGVSWSDWEVYSTSIFWTLTSGDGEKTVYFQAKDALGNIADYVTDTIILDTVLPTGMSISINGGAEYTSDLNVILTLSASDATPMQMCFKNEGRSQISDWEDFSTSKSWELYSRGTNPIKTVRFYIMDAAGNIQLDENGEWEPCFIADDIFYDPNPPIVQSIVINNGDQYTGSQTVTLTVEATDDGGSGVWEMRFSNDGVSWSDWEPYSQTKSGWTLTSGEGTKTVWVMVKDKAGLESATMMDDIELGTIY